MTRTGRNDPCPCGSGKKYKQCCLRADEDAARRRRLEQGAPDRALEWLAKHHEEAASEALQGTYLGVLGELGFEKLQELPDEILDLVDLNAHEWLLVDGAIQVDGQSKRVMDLILGPGGALLDALQRSYLERLVASPLRLYAVAEVEKGKGVAFQDLLSPELEQVFVHDESAASNLKVGEVFGARLVPGEVWQLSGAGYQFPPELVGPLLVLMGDDVQAASDATSDPEELEEAIRTNVTHTIIHSWLHYLVEELESETDLDREPLVVDRYRLFDRAALVEILRADPRFHGDPAVACVWVPEDGDDQRPVAVTPDHDSLETSGSHPPDLDRLRDWLEAHAAETVAFTEREIFSE